MNYLAHAFLSGSDSEILTGNLIGDFVKGNDQGKYSRGVWEGVVLHRKIDAFTDRHPVVRRSLDRIRPEFRHYSSVFMDVFYDHLLGRSFDRYSEQTLDDFVIDVDECFQKVKRQTPGLFHPRWINVEWLSSYATKGGLERSLKRVSKRARRKLDPSRVLDVLYRNYSDIDSDFHEFFPLLMAYVDAELEFSAA